MYLLSVILAYLLTFSIYYLGKILFLALFGKPIFTFSIRQLKMSVGFFIPYPWLARFYRYENGVKSRPRL